jgi:signal transduction histidine kinase/ligand-binding sensor domain-containing protein
VLSFHSSRLWAARLVDGIVAILWAGAGVSVAWAQEASVVGAAEPAPPAPELFDVWRVEEGWQPSAVTALLQSRVGYLWFGTYHGLVRFDGVRYTVYDSSNTPNLENGLITSLYEDSTQRLWIGHETGQLTVLDAGRFQPVPRGSGWPEGSIETICSDADGDIWLLTDHGRLFRPRDGKLVEVPGGAGPTRKSLLVRATDGGLWIVANGKVYTLAQGQLRPFAFPDAQPGDYYEYVVAARDGGLWVLGKGRFRKWHRGAWGEELPVWPRTPGALTTGYETRSGALLAGSFREGVYLIRSGQEPLHFSRTNGLSGDWVRCCCEDSEGGLWVGTAAGLDGLRPRKVQMLVAPDGWQGCGVLSFSVRADGSAWIGTEGAGLYRYDRGRWTNFNETHGLSNLFVWSVLETRRQKLRVGTYGGGLFSWNGERFESPPRFRELTSPIVCLFESREGDLWIGCKSGLLRYQGGRLTSLEGPAGSRLMDTRAAAQSHDGTLWFGMSGGGLASLKDGIVKQYRQRDGLGSDLVVCLYADEDDTLWVGTSDNGLTRFKDGRFAIISTDQGLPSRIICHIVDDGANNLWMGSHAGILRARKADLNRCADGLSRFVPCLSYGKPEGLASSTCSGGFQPGACRTSDGRLWFPTPKGLAIVDPLAVTGSEVPPPVVIEKLLVDGRPVKIDTVTPERALFPSNTNTDSLPARNVPSSSRQPAPREPALRIPAGSQRFEFRYTGLSFMSPDKVRFLYRLVGLETEWTVADTERVAPYSYLRPGDYTFQVKACNNDGVWNETGASLSFTILPFFWQTIWFRAGAVGAGVALVAVSVMWTTRRRVRRKLEQLERQRALERERARIARDIHDDLGASLTRITMLSQTVRADLDGQAETAAEVDQIYRTARELTRAMDEIVWAVNPQHDTLDSLVTYLGRYAQQFLSVAGIRCRLDVPLNLPQWALSAEVRHNVFLAFKEALNNVVRHAGATEVRITLTTQSGGFALSIVDNGRGFLLPAAKMRSVAPVEPSRLASGNGLGNMQRRLAEAGGRCEWTSAPSEGTRVTLSIPEHRFES